VIALLENLLPSLRKPMKKISGPLKLKLFFFCSISFMLFLSCEKSPPKISPLGPGATIVAFGDSLTYGTGAAQHESYPALLEQITGIRVINEGVLDLRVKEIGQGKQEQNQNNQVL